MRKLIRYWIIWKFGQYFEPNREWEWFWYREAYRVRLDDLKKRPKIPISCRIGLHDWYKNNFSNPVWGRYERHCLSCDKKQYSSWVTKGKKKIEQWITF